MGRIMRGMTGRGAGRHAALALVLLCLPLLVALAIAGCREAAATEPPAATEPAKAEYRKITPQEAKAMLDSDQPVTLVDVRTEGEHRERRIAGSLLLPDYEVGRRAAEVLPDKDATILLYCRSGRRSRVAAEALLRLGYTRVYDFGGLNDWPYETVSGQ